MDREVKSYEETACTFLCVVLIMLCTPLALADSEEGIQPYDLISCPYCGSGIAYEVCLGDAIVADTDTHSCSSGTCTITQYDCKGGIYCPACTRTYRYGHRHPCYVLHNKCGESKHTICYIAVGGWPQP